MLTQFELILLVPLYLAAAIALGCEQRTQRVWIQALTGGVLAALIVLPWFAYNEATYQALTANSLARTMQAPIVNPHHVYYSALSLPAATVNSVLAPQFPQEWEAAQVLYPTVEYMLVALMLWLVPAGLAFGVASWRRLLQSGWWLLAGAYLLNVALLWWTTWAQQWNVMLGRYTLATLPALAVFTAGTTVSAIRTPQLVVVAAGVFILAIAIAWIRLSLHFL
jgi:hypothetical protein